MATRKKKTASKSKGFRVSYSMLLFTGKWKREVTTIIYNSRQAAQRYADQLNASNRYKNARVRKA
jgi:hypothetical protein